MYSTYKHLVGLSYTSGDQDCYGLAIRYYSDVFGLQLTDFARPDEWWLVKELNLLTDNLFNDGWENVGVNLRNLKIGDGLVFSLLSGKANHVGMYVGNGMFLHHVFGRISCEEALVQKWMSRCLMVVRHEHVSKRIEEQVKPIDYKELMKNVRNQT